MSLLSQRYFRWSENFNNQILAQRNKKEHFDRWHKELSPSRELLKKYKNNKIDFQTFERLFLEEIEKSNAIDICKEIVNKSMEGKNITLLCYEKDEEICHRKFVKNICEQELLKINN